jgi:hypothetical protein
VRNKYRKTEGNSMKKLLSLQALMLMSLVIGSTSLIEAYNNSNKYASKETKKNNKIPAQSDKASMKSIEKLLHEIQREFEKSNDAKAANKKLNAIPAQIKKAIATMKKDEKHGKIWETHLHTLNRKLREIREYIQKHTKKIKIKK